MEDFLQKSSGEILPSGLSQVLVYQADDGH